MVLGQQLAQYWLQIYSVQFQVYLAINDSFNLYKLHVIKKNADNIL